MNNEARTEILHQKLAASGLRSTRQREIVYDAILSKRDHPTADEIFARAKHEKGLGKGQGPWKDDMGAVVSRELSR